MIIYQLKILWIEDKEISENTHSWECEVGHYSSLENVKNAIIEYIKNDVEDEIIISIFCTAIEIDVKYGGSINITYFFNKEGEIISTIDWDDDNVTEVNKDFKVGDIIAIHTKSYRPMKIGIIGDVANETSENTYYVKMYNDEMKNGIGEWGLDHSHLRSEEMFKANAVSPELVYFLKTQLKDVCSEKEYQQLFREDKLKRLTNGK